MRILTALLVSVTVLTPLSHGQTQSVQVFVTSFKGEPLTDLKQGEISVQRPRVKSTTLTYVGREAACIGLLFDTSGSVTSVPAEWKKAILESSRGFLAANLRKGIDLAFVESFDRDTQTLQDFTDDPQEVNQAFLRLTSGGPTALYDAIAKASTRFSGRPCARRVLIVFTDGENTRKVGTAEMAVDAAQKAGVAVLAFHLQGRTYDEESLHADAAVLREVARKTGGLFFEIDSVKSVNSEFSRMASMLSALYRVEFEASHQNEPQAFSLKLNRRNITVLSPGRF